MFLIPDNFWQVRNTEEKGKGVFAKKDLAPGVIIGDYLGTVYKITEEDFYEKDEDLYLMYYSDRAFLYPDLKKDGVHLLNHSCAPNCWMYTYKGHTLFFTLRHIFEGEELTISYQLPPENIESKANTYICKCKSFICSKSMRLTPEKYKKWVSFHEKQSKLTKMERVKYRQELLKLKVYPKRILDNPIYPLFGSDLKSPEVLENISLPNTSDIRKLIRQGGKTIQFPKLNKLVLGVSEDLLVTKLINL